MARQTKTTSALLVPFSTKTTPVLVLLSRKTTSVGRGAHSMCPCVCPAFHKTPVCVVSFFLNFFFIVKTVRRQYQRMDRPGVRQVPEGSGEERKMEETGREIICDIPTTLVVKG